MNTNRKACSAVQLRSTADSRFGSAIAVFVGLLVTASSIFAGPYKTEIISAAGNPLVLTVADQTYLRITNFTQEGGSARGIVTVTINGQSADVLTATQLNSGSLATAQEPINKVIIAGPATVTISPVPGATLSITYKRTREGTPQITPAPTPTPTATTTITPTPTPTPTPSP